MPGPEQGVPTPNLADRGRPAPEKDRSGAAHKAADPPHKDGLPGEDITGPQGNYKINSKGRSGLVPGKYHVVISKDMVEPSKVNEQFKEDPFMASLSAGPEVGRDAAKLAAERAKARIETAFDREVPPEGGQQDFDVKRKAD